MVAETLFAYRTQNANHSLSIKDYYELSAISHASSVSSLS